ncbi:hypothetical protein F4805DRAFT_409114 [Annulohypoxylon moriforme]|nr:hypothetical protein F4805DRAFT_409114 [Annulohypoxylon moriforme]
MPAFFGDKDPNKPKGSDNTPHKNPGQGAVPKVSPSPIGNWPQPNEKGENDKGGNDHWNPGDHPKGPGNKSSHEPSTPTSTKPPDQTSDIDRGGKKGKGGGQSSKLSMSAAATDPTSQPTDPKFTPTPSNAETPAPNTEASPTGPATTPAITTTANANPPDTTTPKPTDSSIGSPDPSTDVPAISTETPSPGSTTEDPESYSQTAVITDMGYTKSWHSHKSNHIPMSTTYSTFDPTATTPTPTPTTTTTPAIAGASTRASSNALPPYAILLIVLAALVVIGFLAALAVFRLRKRRKAGGGGIPKSGQWAIAGAGAGGASGGKGGEWNKPRYLHVISKAAVVATGATGLLWVAKKLSGREREERKERERAYFEEVAAYAKLGEDHDHEHDLASEKELEVEMGNKGGRQTFDRGRESERGYDGASQRSESAVVMSAALGYTLAPAPALISVTSPMRRSPSEVSSLSSSTRSQGQYERLVPSPVTDETPYVWTPPPVPPINQGVGLENRRAQTGAEMGERRRSAVPAALRPGGGARN